MSNTAPPTTLSAADADHILIQAVTEDGELATYRDVDDRLAKWQATLVFPQGETLVVESDGDEEFSDTLTRIAAQLPEMRLAYKDAENELPADHVDCLDADLSALTWDDPEMEDAENADGHVLDNLREDIHAAAEARQQAAPVA